MKLLQKLLMSFIGLMLITINVSADGVFIAPSDGDLVEPTQKAVIHYENGVEKMLLNVTYSGEVDEFAWMVPMPNIPEISEGDFAVFEELNQLYGSFETPKQMAGAMAEDSLVAPRPLDVNVIERKKVGVFDVTTLEAGDASDLEIWLNQNGYEMMQSKRYIFDQYIDKDWVFVAMRISPDEYSSDMIGNLKNGNVEPLVFEFESSRPVFPLYISRGNENTTELLLYLIGDGFYTNKDLEVIRGGEISISTLNYREALAEFLEMEDEIDRYDYDDDEYYEPQFKVTKYHEIIDPFDMNDLYFDEMDEYEYRESVLKNYNMNDVSFSDEFYPYIKYLAVKGIANTTFRKYYNNCYGIDCPNGYTGYNMGQDMTRADFTRYVVKSIPMYPYEYELVDIQNFDDVPTNHKDYVYIREAMAYGMVRGYPDGKFYPENPITRGEAMKILAKALDIAGVVNLSDIEKLNNANERFTDLPTYHEFYRHISAATMLGLVNGYSDGSFRQQNDVTRGESAKIVVKARMLTKHLPRMIE